MKVTVPEISFHNRDPVLSVDIQPNSPDGITRMATGGTDTHVLVWQLNPLPSGGVSVEVLCDLTRHNRAVNAVRFSPDGALLASADDEAAILVWKKAEVSSSAAPDLFATEGEERNKENWTIYKILRGHIEDVYDLSWSSCGSFLVSGSIDNSAILWDVHKGKNIGLLKEHKNFVQGVAWDPLGQFVATLSSDRVLRWFSVSTKKAVHRASKAELPVLLSSGQMSTISTRLFYDDTLKSFCRRLSFSPDGLLLAAPAGILEGEQLGTRFLHAVHIFTRMSPNKPVLYLPTRDKYSLAVRFCPLLFKLRPGREGSPHRGQSLFALPYRMVLAVACQNSLVLYDTQQLMPFAIVSNMHITRLTDLAWSSDGRILVISSTDGYCSVTYFSEGELGEVYTKDDVPPPPLQPKSADNAGAPLKQNDNSNTPLLKKGDNSSTPLKPADNNGAPLKSAGNRTPYKQAKDSSSPRESAKSATPRKAGVAEQEVKTDAKTAHLCDEKKSDIDADADKENIQELPEQKGRSQETMSDIEVSGKKTPSRFKKDISTPNKSNCFTEAHSPVAEILDDDSSSKPSDSRVENVQSEDIEEPSEDNEDEEEELNSEDSESLGSRDSEDDEEDEEDSVSLMSCDSEQDAKEVHSDEDDMGVTKIVHDDEVKTKSSAESALWNRRRGKAPRNEAQTSTASGPSSSTRSVNLIQVKRKPGGSCSSNTAGVQATPSPKASTITSSSKPPRRVALITLPRSAPTPPLAVAAPLRSPASSSAAAATVENVEMLSDNTSDLCLKLEDEATVCSVVDDSADREAQSQARDLHSALAINCGEEKICLETDPKKKANGTNPGTDNKIPTTKSVSSEESSTISTQTSSKEMKSSKTETSGDEKQAYTATSKAESSTTKALGGTPVRPPAEAVSCTPKNAPRTPRRVSLITLSSPKAKKCLNTDRNKPV